MKQFAISITLLLLIASCVPVPTSSSNSTAIQYTDVNYSTRVGNVRLTPNIPTPEYQSNVINLTKNIPHNLIFDLLDEDYVYLHMKLFHCDWNWNKSQLNELEYLAEFNEFPINYYEFSQNNTSEFVSYAAQLPRMTKSGNYVLAVYESSTDELLFTRRIMAYEQSAFIQADKTMSNGASFRRTHQQIDFEYNYGSLETSNPGRDFKTVLLQNQNWATALINPTPTNYLMDQRQVQFQYYNQESNFPGLNNFRFFDARSLTYRGQNVFSIRQSARGIEVILEEDKPTTTEAYGRPLQPNLAGKYYTRNLDPNSKDLNAEYVWVNFKLKAPKIQGKVYIAGRFNQWQLNEDNLMKYDEASESYLGSVWIKQGYYSYMYFVNSPTMPYYELEGTHFETINDYEMLVYYRAPGTVYDRLVGYKKF